ncbi:DNA polymerase III subunit gamma/tau [Halioglobus japonicus]|uniref:DNA polymerase III subunit gamma/tau n=1 Tax=Halioglobus japonicus TaxID=930805 RepID=A0AAP8SNL9_9GAMM|nr:DNA polymerase III subunit gamma/tau [Halioglobus japonicus]PLW86762.1 DNA polymerase III subunit gamma/tau [Halioglobus japonicus]GHD11194.1 DNA polymerase III subunit gamma/tau [Halioglobus japonicus]
MSYQVLARKWRPKSFREMVGQEHVLQALINALDHDRLHHAYLFTGTRGVGKTTIARILAKCLNCEQGVSSEPCGECGSCLEIAEGRSVDLLEVDAASRTKVEDTRELLENVQYAPTRSRYKIYLIDEVHMLSNSSFNALLKTLEEPPPHVKFLLATTDPQKLLPTVLSRCLQFNLKNMPPEQIVGHLRNVLEQEMVSFEDPALYLLGRAASGSMRDALSLTDQAIAFGSGKLVESDVRAMLGTVDLTFVYQMLEAVVAGSANEVLAIVERMSEHAPDFEGSIDELISLVHRVAVAQVVPDAIDNSWGDAERVAALAAAMTAEDAQLYYQMAVNGKRDMAYTPDPRGGFEMLLLRMLAFRPAAVIDTSLSPEQLQAAPAAAVEGGEPVKKPIEQVAPPVMPAVETAPVAVTPEARPEPPVPAEPAPASLMAALATPSQPEVVETTPVESRPAESATPAVAPADLSQLVPAAWPQTLEQLGLLGMVYSIASNCELISVDGPALKFVLDEANASLFNDGHSKKIALALQNYFGRELSVSIDIGKPPGETPAMVAARAARERQALAVAEIDSDERLQALLTRFDGELDRASIAPTDS